MNRRVIWMSCFVWLVMLACWLTLPANCHAARTTEVETNYYYCEQDDASLAECEWLGMRFFPCTGTSWTEGVTDDPSINYKVVSTQSCSSGHLQTSCFVAAFSGDPVPVSCFRWPWFPWPLPEQTE
jgi:hypothetical protein